MLNVSKRKQAKRFTKRIDHPAKNWKFSPSDVRERRYWEEYQRAFDSMLSHTSTQWAPWYVVPADHRWFSHLATAGVLVTALSAINPRYPAADPAERDHMALVRAELVQQNWLPRSPAECTPRRHPEILCFTHRWARVRAAGRRQEPGSGATDGSRSSSPRPTRSSRPLPTRFCRSIPLPRNITQSLLAAANGPGNQSRASTR